jgi:pilus assembly protein CpaF
MADTTFSGPMMVPLQTRARKQPTGRSPQLDEIARRIHNRLLDMPELPEINKQGPEAIQRVLASMVREVTEPISSAQREELTARLLDDVIGLGPLQPLLEDPNISDILVNTHRSVFVDIGGVTEETEISFNSEQHLRNVIDRIVSRVGRRLDESSPMVDARLPDGSRVNAIIPPLAIDGSCLSIRVFPQNALTPRDLVDRRALSQPMMQVLDAAVRAKLNIVISGGTSSGKTTLLNVLSSYISPRERVITIEDSAELQLNRRNVVRLETRPPNIEGKGTIRQRELLINALRMRPDRIILGEVRGEEALDVLQAMNTGHEGSMTTVHANSPRDMISRIETMCAMGATNLPAFAIRSQIAAAVNLVVQASRMSDGSRRITHISEVTGMSGDIVSMQDIFKFDRMGIDSQRRIKGTFRGCGIVPRFHEKFREAGISISEGIYESQEEG